MTKSDSNSDSQANDDGQSISLAQLSQSFAQLIGERKSPATDDVRNLGESPGHDDDNESAAEYSLEDVCPTTPQTILESMLFVGHPSNAPLTSRQAASLIRGVSPTEVDALVKDLNASYDAHAAPYRIVSEGAGYRMSLLPEYDGLRERFYGRIRQVRLSQSAVDVLALVAYNQPITKQQIEELRQRPSGGVLSQLVRRQLLRLERVGEKKVGEKTDRENEKTEHQKRRQVLYRTTDRFLETFGLTSIDELPRSQEMDPAP